jgi:hypothetical protein
VNQQELRAVAATVVIPDGATDLKVISVSEPGERLPDGSWAGRGGTTRFGPAWMINGGLETSPPIETYESVRDAMALHALVAGPEGELWQRRERRRERLAQIIADEEAAAAEEKAAARAAGGGSPRRSRSSATHTASNGEMGLAIARLSQKRSRATSSQRPSSS